MVRKIPSIGMLLFIPAVMRPWVKKGMNKIDAWPSSSIMYWMAKVRDRSL